MNMLATIVPKSDQLNSDDLIGRSLTITITKVDITAGTEQPVSLHFEGDGGKPYKACKSMRRVLVQAWGPDAKVYEGRSLTLFRDPAVLWAGQQVGGIRISHMSDIKGPLTMALTATKKTRAAFTVQPIGARKQAAPPPADDPEPPRTDETEPPSDAMLNWVNIVLDRFAKCTSAKAMFGLIDEIKGNREVLAQDAPDLEKKIVLAVKEANARLAPKPPVDGQ